MAFITFICSTQGVVANGGTGNGTGNGTGTIAATPAPPATPAVSCCSVTMVMY